MGEFHGQLGHHERSAAGFRRALQLAEVGPEQLYLARRLEATDRLGHTG